MSQRVGVNLLTWNLGELPEQAAATEYALRSLLDTDLRNWDWRLVIVDNASRCDRTVQILQELEGREARVMVDWQEANLGIARGRNRAYQLLQEWHAPEFVVEIHTDHIFPDYWLAPIMNEMLGQRFPRCGIMSPSLLTPAGWWRSPQLKIDYSDPYAKCRGAVEMRAKPLRNRHMIREGIGHPAVKRWAMFEEIGVRRDGLLYPYDPDLPGGQNFEDTEEALRAYQANWQSLVHFGSCVYHNYHLTRLATLQRQAEHAAAYDANNRYVQLKHGPAVWAEWHVTMGRWMERLYAR